MFGKMVKRIWQIWTCKHQFLLRHKITVDAHFVKIWRCEKCGFIQVKVE